ncbi:MAG: hypothetical protein IKW32_06040 [Bacteroidaceae bacterium]|nr:hypothetical protein [Bacteroidaceae bacterium]
MEKLQDLVQTDILLFLDNNNELLFNERDFQMHLATYLRESKHYDDVDVEYYVPQTELKDYVWQSELRIDIVVRKEEKYFLIELKYKTKKVEKEIARLGEFLKNKVVVMKNQGAQDLGMYDFWKDVRRIELVRNRFGNVKGGLAVFVTNDESYEKESKASSNHVNFSMSKGKHSIIKHWLNPNSTCAKTHPNFEVEKEYEIQWNHTDIENIKFNYCLINV